MAPPPCVCICGSSCRMQSQTPLRFTAIIRSNASSDHSAVFFPAASTCQPAIPALLKAQSRRPWAPTTASIIARTSASRDMSPDSDIACPPVALTSATVSRAASAIRSATATRAPSRAKARAVARPIPPPPPVISADFPSSIPAIAPLPELSQPRSWHSRLPCWVSEAIIELRPADGHGITMIVPLRSPSDEAGPVMEDVARA